MKAPHDMGGDPAGPIETDEHEKAFWEYRVDAIRNLTRHLVLTDEMRRMQEGLGKELYDKLSYTERTITSYAGMLLQKGILTTADLTRKLAEIDEREKNA